MVLVDVGVVAVVVPDVVCVVTSHVLKPPLENASNASFKTPATTLHSAAVLAERTAILLKSKHARSG